MLAVIAIGSDNIVRLDKLKDASADAYVNSATVTFTLKDSAGGVVQGPTAMSYIASSDGRYEGLIQDTLTLTENAAYTLEVTATQGSTVLLRKVSAIAKYRSTQ